MADSKSDGSVSKEDSSAGGSSLRMEHWKTRDEGSENLGTSKLVSGPSESDSKDFGNAESTIPLSPQWLLPKSGEIKLAAPSSDPPRGLGSPTSGYGMNDAPVKDRWRNLEGGSQDPKRNRDWWRTISMERDTDSSRRERWREEEREGSNNMTSRRDRWKEGERDTVGDQTAQAQNRRAVNERWPDMNAAGGRESVEPLRRVPSERWADTQNRESNFDNRRDNKWSNRWGPDEKEKEFRGKRGGDGSDKEVGKEGIESGGYHHRYVANAHNVMRDADRERERERERESDTSRHDRAWRPSFASRGRGETSHVGNTPPKMAPGFMTGRGRGEPYGVGFTVGRGRGNPQTGLLHGPPLSSIGSPFLIDRWDTGKENVFRYPRVKLLDIHRKCGISFFQKYPEGFTVVPQLTQSDPLEPMAFFQPDAEEEAVLEGIRKGEIVSSGAVHNSTPKEGSLNRGMRQDSLGRGRGRGLGRVVGGKEDSGFDGHREDDIFDQPGFGSTRVGDGGAMDKQAEARFADAEESWESRARAESGGNNDGARGLAAKEESVWRRGRAGEEAAFVREDGSWRRDSVARSDGAWRKTKADDEVVGTIKDEKLERHEQMCERDERTSLRRDEQDDSKLEGGISVEGDVCVIENVAERGDQEGYLGLKDATSAIPKPGRLEELGSVDQVEVSKETYVTNSTVVVSTQEMSVHQVAPEELCLLYTDPQGEVQGPFLGVDIIGWFEAGFFGLDLPVRLMDAPEGTPFTALENIMPHLKPAVKVPLGFTSALKRSEDGGESIHTEDEGYSSSLSYQLKESSGGENVIERRGGIFEPSLDIGLNMTDNSQNMFGNEFHLGLNGKISSYKPVDRFFEKGDKELGAKAEEASDQLYSMRKRMSMFPRVDTETSETGNMGLPNLFPQNEGSSPASGQPLFSAPNAPRSPSMQPDLLPMLQSGHGHLAPGDQPWADTLLRNLSLDVPYPHVGLPSPGSGMDSAQLAQQLEHLEIQHLQRMGSSGSALQRQLSGAPPPPPSSRINLEQMMWSAGLPPRDHQGLNPLHLQMPAQQHQAPLPIPPSGPTLEQLLRMQQQQLPTQVLIEQLLRSQSIPPPAHLNHLHRQGSGLVDQLLLGRQPQDPRLFDTSGQHLSNREFEQLMLARQNHTSSSSFEQLIRQKQQEEQQQLMQFGLSVPQQQQTLEDMRVSGVWEVDEFGQFVRRTQSPAPMRPFEAFQNQHHHHHHHQQQQQQHHHRLQSQLNYPGPMPQEPQDLFGFEQASLLDPELMEPRVPMNMFDPNLLRRERNLSGIPGMGAMEGKLVAQMQEQQLRTRADRQNNLSGLLDSDMERFRRDAFDLRQVQERQQQVEAAAAARVLGLGSNARLESRPKSGDRRMGGQVDIPGNSALLPGLRWPPIVNNESSQKQDLVHERSMRHPSLGLWGQESQDYGSAEQQFQDGARSGTFMTDHVPLAATPSGAETPRSSVVRSPPEASYPRENWSLSSLHSNELSANAQAMEGKGQTGSAVALTQPEWKAAAGLNVKSPTDVQEEETANRKAGEQSTVESMGQPVSNAGIELGAWAAPSVPQPKFLREIHEEEAQRAAAALEAAQKSGHSQINAATSAQKVLMSRTVDPPSWVTGSANTDKGSLLFDGGDEQAASQISRQGSELEASMNQSGQILMQSTAGFDDSDFESKESKKNKKRAVKGKSSTPVKPAGDETAGELSHVTSPLTSSKSTASRSVQVESSEESSPTQPPGSSLADFLSLESEPAINLQPLPAWLATPGRQVRMGKSLSLKEIQEAEKGAREEKERQNEMLRASLVQKNTTPPSAKPITLMRRSGSGGTAWQRPGVVNPSGQAVASESQAKIPAGSGGGSSRLKVGVFEDDDDLFWDYGRDAKTSTGAVKQIEKSEPLDFSTLLPGQGQGQANVVASKPAAIALTAPVFRQAAVVKASPTDFPSLSATAVSVKAPATKAKKQASNKVTGPQVSAEVKALRQWCEAQLKKLSADEDVTNVDFSIVDFCISLPSISEASDYLSQYLGTLPGVTQQHIQAFRKEFVRRKEQLPSDGNASSSDNEYTDALFGSNGKKVDRSKSGTMDMARLLKEDMGQGEFESTTSPGSGKKKNKKGKKVVDPSLLGFSVTSNRIMMGEIHHIDD